MEDQINNIIKRILQLKLKLKTRKKKTREKKHHCEKKIKATKIPAKEMN